MISKTSTAEPRARWRGAFVALAAAAALAVGAAPAYAKKKSHKDEVRGFQCSIEDSFEQVPPKPGTDDAHVAAEWKDPSPKYRRFSADQPTFKIIWTVTPKGDAPPPEDIQLPGWAKDLPPEIQEQIKANMAGTKESLEGDVNYLMERLAFLFGPYKPFQERLEEQGKKFKTIKTKSKQELRILEVNYHKKRPKDTDATWWLWIAFTEFETPEAKIELGFYGYVDVQFAKSFRKQFESVVKSFKLREIRSEEEVQDKFADAVRDKDPPEVREKLIKFCNEKLPKDWTYKRTDNYLVIYDEDVDSKRIVNRVVKEIEALREQVYEVLFPPDREITAISIVRVCDSREQYMGYGAPGGSAGYWSPGHEELVLYQDKNDKKDAIRVLYHEAFHQYIFYSVGEISPHSWFNEGHGDFFSGHVYKGGKFKREPFGWRTETAREAKKRWKEGWERKKNAPEGEPEHLHLREWLTWRQRQYYGSNDWNIPGGVNYALGWSFIYFLRTTKNEEYQRILPRYFNALKSFVTQAREEAEKARDALGEGLGGGEGEGGEGGPAGEGGEPPPREGGPEASQPAEHEDGTTDKVTRDQWHGESLKEATQGIDLDQLQKDWLDHSW